MRRRMAYSKKNREWPHGYDAQERPVRGEFRKRKQWE
jgi:hypothetical protein